MNDWRERGFWSGLSGSGMDGSEVELNRRCGFGITYIW